LVFARIIVENMTDPHRSDYEGEQFQMAISEAVVDLRPVGVLELLKSNSRFRQLWVAQLISAGGDWFNTVALLGLVIQLTHSGFGASLVIISSTTPQFFVTPIAGPIVDRFDRRMIMILTNLVSTLLALVFLLVRGPDTVWLIYVGSALLIVSASFFGPASSASIPNVVSREELFAANTLSGATWGIMAMVGSALGGLFAAAFGRDAAFVINSISFLLAGLIIATIAIPSPKIDKDIAPWRDFVDGLRYLRNYLPSVAMVAVKTGWGLAGGVIVLLSIFGATVFRAGDAGIGLLYASRGLGALIGPLFVQRVVGHNPTRLRQAVWMAFLLTGFGYLIFASAGSLSLLWLGCLALFVAHFGGGITWVISSVLLQLTTPDHFRGRVFAVDYGLSTLTSGTSTLLFGLALQGGISPMSLALVGAGLFISYGLLWRSITALEHLRI